MAVDLHSIARKLIRASLPIKPSARSTTATAEQRAALEALMAQAAPGPRGGPFLIHDEHEQPIGMLHTTRSTANNRFVVSLGRERRPQHRRVVDSAAIDHSGRLNVSLTGQGSAPAVLAPAHWPGSDEDSTALRLVTADASVYFVGLRAELFEPMDQLVVAAASEIDVISAHQVFRMEGRQDSVQTPGPRFQSKPLPVDEIVLQEFNTLARAWRETTPEKRAQLTVSDVLTAATARAYGLALYTAKPKAYRVLGRSFITVEYGPVRNPQILASPPADDASAIVAPPASGTTAAATSPAAPDIPAGPLECATRAITAFESRDALEDGERRLIVCAAQDFEAYKRLVFGIVRRVDVDRLPWATAVLTHASGFTGDVRSSDSRDDLVLAVREVLPTAQHEADEDGRAAYDSALEVFSRWGEWSEGWHDLLSDLGSTTDPHAARWYLALLRLRGINDDTIETEARLIAEGLDTDAHARFREITGDD